MSRWRRHAFEVFPERRDWIERILGVRELLWLLEADVRATLTGGTHPLPAVVDRAFEYALWCYAPTQSASLRDAAATMFFLRLGALESGRIELVRRLPPDALSELRVQYRARLPAEAFNCLSDAVSREHGSLWAVPDV
jgi:hypothetical protein